ncbi:phage holin family protein [Sanguibacter sp. A247]|uniref:phage holin family protein n=1 Tax=unclassified Sanguibacter TaxID=2645534 RepID=UPI003FD80A1B
MSFVLRVIVNAFALWITSLLVSGFFLVGSSSTEGKIAVLLGTAAIFGVINAAVRPIVALVSTPFYILTLGLFTFVVNALMLMLTAWITEQTSWGIRIEGGFWTAIVAALLVSIVSFCGSLAIGRADRSER